MTLGAMTAGVPIAPASVAYSLQSRDHARIRAIAELIRPGAVFAEDADRFAAALDAVGAVPAIVSTGRRPGAERLDELMTTVPGQAVTAAFDALDGDAVAKILFTSGSTGTPKGVLNTHRMLSANQQMMRQVWPFLACERPVIVDWLPWSHTFGGNHNMNMMLTCGGTLYVDAGRPAPGMFAQTIANLTDVPPTIYFNVPAGYAQLVPALQSDPAFAARFFSRLRLIFNAAAALPAALRGRLERAGGAQRRPRGSGHRILGRDRDRPGGDDGALRLRRRPLHRRAAARHAGQAGPGRRRVRDPGEGPDRDTGLLRAAGSHRGSLRSSDGFYPYRRRGGIRRPRRPERRAGIPGTHRGGLQAHDRHVRAGRGRAPALLSALPMLSDAVIAGENRDFACALAWLNAAEARRLVGEELRPQGELIVHEVVHRTLAQALADHNATAGSAARVERLVVMARPADLDGGEITDKGYVNQRQVLINRSTLVELLYAQPAPAHVIVAGRTA